MLTSTVKYSLTGLYVLVCLAVSIIFIQLGHDVQHTSTVHTSPIVHVSYVVGRWQATTDGKDENLFCSNDGAYIGHISRNEKGWVDTFIEQKNEGSFIDVDAAKRHVEEITADQCK